MRHLYTQIFYLMAIYTAQAQLIHAPNINFGGSKVDWVHTVTDTFETDQIFNTIPSFSNKEIGQIQTNPQEFDNKVIFNVSNFNSKYLGTMVYAYDVRTGNEIWARNFNPHFEKDYGYGISMIMKQNSEGNLVLRGFRSKIPFIGSWWSGHFTQRSIDMDTGTNKKEYRNTKQNLGMAVTNPAQSTDESSSFFIYNAFFRVPNQSYDAVFFPVKIDVKNDTIIDNFLFGDERNVTFVAPTIDDQNSFRIDGPFTNDNITFTYLVQHEINGNVVHWMWKTDKDANVLEKREITSAFGEEYFEAEQKDSLIILITLTRDGVFQGHRGYIFMDMDGHVKRRNSQITIDGKKAGHLSTTTLKGSDEILHVVRFQEDNDIYVYRETKEKQYIKSAHLINNNSSAYAFIPRFIFQSSDKGLVISGSFWMDTLLYPNSLRCNFDCGGWPVIMKLSAETLGLPTATDEVSYHQSAFTMTPNPTSNRLLIKLGEVTEHLVVHIKDQTGRSIMQKDISTSSTEIDVSSLASGLYIVTLSHRNGSQVGSAQKMVKM